MYKRLSIGLISGKLSSYKNAVFELPFYYFQHVDPFTQKDSAFTQYIDGFLCALLR